jgi:hypothetical protein
MRVKGRDAFQRILAVVVIVAMLGVMGIPVTVIVFFAIVTYFVWRAAQRSDHQQIGRIFEFYLSANEILSQDDRSWFGFEIAEVIERGERAMRSMPDPPPLVIFALGALYHRNGDHEAAAEHLAVVVEDDLAAERHRTSPSPDLRRYAEVLRRIEREPNEGPKTVAAIHSLERARRQRAAAMLRDSRERLARISGAGPAELSESNRTSGQHLDASGPGLSVSAPPSISDVLRDVYEEEKKTA